MFRSRTAPNVKKIIAQIQHLSEDQQRALAGAILKDRKLEAFVEELDDHLACEKAAAGELAEPFALNSHLTKRH